MFVKNMVNFYFTIGMMRIGGGERQRRSEREREIGKILIVRQIIDNNKIR